jgi:hypothetical protein
MRRRISYIVSNSKNGENNAAVESLPVTDFAAILELEGLSAKAALC